MQREISVETLRKLLKDQPEHIAERAPQQGHARRSRPSRPARRASTSSTAAIFDGLINEIFSNEGVGSLDLRQRLSANPHRPTGATCALSTTSPAAPCAARNCIYRTQQAIEKNIDQFFVFEIDENIIACVTLYFYPDKPQLAEVGSLYVMPFYHNRGIGQKMVEYACLQAKERGATTRRRALDAELRLLHQRLRLRGSRQGNPARGPPEALRGKRPQPQGAGEEALRRNYPLIHTN